MGAMPRRWFAVMACLAVACNVTQPQPSTGPTLSEAAPTPSPGPSTSATRRFEAPGITFEYPAGWWNQTSSVGAPAGPGRRLVATLTRSMLLCSNDLAPELPETGPNGCVSRPAAPGQLRLDVFEYLHLYPSQRPNCGYSGGGFVAFYCWVRPSGDAGFYTFTLLSWEGSDKESADSRAVTRSIDDSLQVAPWEPQPQPANGLIRVATNDGFTFSYPAGWARYFPLRRGDDRPLVTVASDGAFDPPAFTPTALRPFVVPPNSVVIEFKFVRGQAFIDWAEIWKTAGHVVGGQPATLHSEQLDTERIGADELITWKVRLSTEDEASPLTIQIWLSGPDLEAARAAAQRVIDSIEIDPGPEQS